MVRIAMNVSVDGERVAEQLKCREEVEANSSSLDMCLKVKMQFVCSDGRDYELPEISKHFNSISLPCQPDNIQNPPICRSSIERGLSSCLSDPDKAHLHCAAKILLMPIYVDELQWPVLSMNLVAERVASIVTAIALENPDSNSDPDSNHPIFHFVAQVELECVYANIGSREFEKIDAIVKLKRFPVSNQEEEEEELMGSYCSICLQDLISTDPGVHLIRLPNCNHVFHQKCILEWLKKSDFCPLCRDLCLQNLDDKFNHLNI